MEKHLTEEESTDGIPQILTLNVVDFARFSEIQAVHPASLLQ